MRITEKSAREWRLPFDTPSDWDWLSVCEFAMLVVVPKEASEGWRESVRPRDSVRGEESRGSSGERWVVWTGSIALFDDEEVVGEGGDSSK